MVARRWLLLIEGSPVLVGLGWLVAWTNASYLWFFAVWSAVLLGGMSRYALTWAISSGRVEDRHSTVAAYLSRPGRRRMDGALGGVALLVMAMVAWGLFAGPFTDAQAVLAGVGLWVFVGLVQVWALFEFLAASPLMTDLRSPGASASSRGAHSGQRLSRSDRRCSPRWPCWTGC